MDTSIAHCVKALGTTGGAAGAASHAGESGVVLRDFLVSNYDQLRRRLTRHVGCPDTARDSLLEAWLRLEELTREEVAARHGMSLRSVDTVLRQTLDYCATQTGRRAVGGVNTPRRALLHARKRDCGAYASEKEAPTGAYSALVGTAHSLCTVE